MDVTGLSYGENQAVNDLQAAAPLSGPSSRPAQAGPVQMPTGLDAPTEFPNQPVTAGADAGAGPSAADIGLGGDRGQEIRNGLGQWAPVWMRMADSPYATPTFKRQVRQLLARLNQ